jgi:hypothetical protein
LQGHRENIAAGHSRFVVLRGFENLHKFSAYTFWFKAISTPWQLAVSRVISTSLKEKKQERVGKTSKRERERVASRACWQFKEKVECVPSRAYWKVQGKVKGTASRAWCKLHEKVPSEASTAWWDVGSRVCCSKRTCWKFLEK